MSSRKTRAPLDSRALAGLILAELSGRRIVFWKGPVTNSNRLSIRSDRLSFPWTLQFWLSTGATCVIGS
jgi:hypothetical protein